MFAQKGPAKSQEKYIEIPEVKSVDNSVSSDRLDRSMDPLSSEKRNFLEHKKKPVVDNDTFVNEFMREQESIKEEELEELKRQIETYLLVVYFIKAEGEGVLGLLYYL